MHGETVKFVLSTSYAEVSEARGCFTHVAF